MPAKVLLTASKGKLKGKEFTYHERETCILGREEDCAIRLPSDEYHQTVSRHHCLLDMNPPDIRVRDFGSLNGTFVNGKKIGQRKAGQTPEEAAALRFPEHDLKDGDEIAVGQTAFRVSVFVPAVCNTCAEEIPDERKAEARTANGGFQCVACREKAERAKQKATPQTPPKVCAQCGKDVSAESGANRPGKFVCAACRADPLKLVKLLLLTAHNEQGFPPFRGYELVKELGRGGMGAVYLARRSKTGEQVALKMMLPRVASDLRAKEMFLREINNTKALKHRNIVEVRDAGSADGAFFLSLEYCDGGSVDFLMKQNGGKLSVTEASEIVLQALDGLIYAHSAVIPQVKLANGKFGQGRGLVHRDLKPANIFLSGSGNARIAKVGDYGLAKAFDLAGMSGLSCTGDVAGTPVFMPRQQALDCKYAKPDVDVWAIAATLYSMLTGTTPRDFSRATDPWKIILETNAVPIRQRNPAIPKALAAVIDAALVDGPAIHFKTAVEFKRALEKAL